MTLCLGLLADAVRPEIRNDRVPQILTTIRSGFDGRCGWRRDVVACLLETGFVTLDVFSRGDILTALVNRESADVLIVDMTGPADVSTSSFVSHIQARWPDLPVIVSGNSQDAKSSEADVLVNLTVGLNPQQVAAESRKLLNNRDALRA